MPLALTGYETGLLAAALVFMAFALVAALVVPRSRPEFPSKYLGWFIAACIVLFAVQMTAVLLLAELGGEHEVAHEEPGETTDTTPTDTTPTDTTPTDTTPTDTTPTDTEPPPSGGDPVAGKQIFLAECAVCHTLADAGATAEVGPNLDESRPPLELVVERVTNGQGLMPPFKDRLSEQQIQDVAAYVSTAAGG